MVPPEVNAALAWLHIFAAIGWMGTAMFLVMVLTPSMLGLSPSSRKELVLRLFPRFIRYVTVFATLAIVAGIGLTFGIASDSLASLSPTNPWGFRVTVGASLALIAYIVGLGIGVRSARKIVRLLGSVGESSQQGPQAEVVHLQRRMRLSATSVIILLIAALVFMVAASRL